MTRLKFIGAAAILGAVIAGPASAQTVSNSGYRGDRQMEYRDSNNFWPGEVAADVVGGAIGTAGAAVGTAGAIATAPFRGPYAARNGFVCEPGTWFRGEDGRRHPCQ